MLLVKNEADGHAEDAHDDDVVHGQAHVLAVVQGGDLDVPGLPGQEGTEKLKGKEGAVGQIKEICRIELAFSSSIQLNPFHPTGPFLAPKFFICLN